MRENSFLVKSITVKTQGINQMTFGPPLSKQNEGWLNENTKMLQAKLVHCVEKARNVILSFEHFKAFGMDSIYPAIPKKAHKVISRKSVSNGPCYAMHLPFARRLG